MTLVNFKNPNAHLKVTAIMYLTVLNSMNKTSYKLDSLSHPMESISLLSCIWYSYEAVLKSTSNDLNR